MKKISQIYQIIFVFLFFLFSFPGCSGSQFQDQGIEANTNSIHVNETTRTRIETNLNDNNESTVSPTNTPTAKIIESTLQATITVSSTETVPTPSPVTILPHISVAYSKHIKIEGSEHSEIWIVDLNNQISQLIYSTGSNQIILADDVRWHPENNALFFTQADLGFGWRLWRYDLDSSTAEPVTTSFFPGLGLIRDWSSNGKWLSIYTEDPTNQEQETNHIIINVESGKSLALENVGEIYWHPENPDLFVYYSEDGRNIIIANTNESYPSETIPVQFSSAIMQNIEAGFKPLTRFAWNPSNTNLIIIEANGELFSYDLDKNEWNFISSLEIITHKLLWSPNGDWLIFDTFDGLYSVNKNTLASAPISIAKIKDFVVIEGWLPQSDAMIFFTDDSLWLLNLNFPKQQIELLELNKIGLTSEINLDIRIVP